MFATLPSRVRVTDVVLRDGLQDEAAIVSTSDKVAIVQALVDAGVRHLEATSFVHPDVVPQLADADRLMAELPRADGVKYAVLVPNRRGGQRAVRARADELRLVVSASDAHNRANLNRSTADTLEELKAVCREVIAEAPATTLAAGVATSFDAPDGEAVPIADVLAILAALRDMGVSEVQLADTTGTATPLQVHRTVDAVGREHPDLDIGLHLHDTRGMGLANVVAGIEADVTRFDASLGGLGGCPFALGAAGNIPTEDLVHMLHAMGVSTGLDPERLDLAADMLRAAVGHDLESAAWRIRRACEPTSA